MVSSAAVTRVLTPSVRMAEARTTFQLERMIPTRFGDWRVDTSMTPLQVDPATQAKLDVIYNQTLSRTYVNSAGQRVMLSIAYGGNQDDNTGVHRPEICYAAQGFEVSNNAAVALATPYGAVPARRLLAVNGGRREPITYWITVGDKAIEPGFEQKMLQLRLGLSGKVPDGMLVRVSTIDSDSAAAYSLQGSFVEALLRSVDAPARERLIGVFGA